jgi:2-polyprenyl-6-methoxyphenol hydroxylase-like FAD-dependent oxidoreductase
MKTGLVTVELRSQASSSSEAARAVIVADGLGGTSLDSHPALAATIGARSRFGVQTTTSDAVLTPPAGVVRLCCDRAGYVGMVRFSDGTTDLAAALDPAATRERGGPVPLINTILARSSIAGALAQSTLLRGTPLMTRRRPAVEGPSVIVAGDAAAYVEPFTGEGMSWAVAAGRAAGEHAARMVTGSAASGEWTDRIHALLASRHWTCRVVATAVRSPSLVHAIVRLGGAFPRSFSLAAAPFARSWSTA